VALCQTLPDNAPVKHYVNGSIEIQGVVAELHQAAVELELLLKEPSKKQLKHQ